MKVPMKYPGVGTCIFIRKEGKILLGLRKGGHGSGEWCAPGGKMEMGESPEECARRETKEETGLEVGELHFIGITSDIWSEVGTQFITIFYAADWMEGEPALQEPDKFERWGWFSWDALPEPLFLSTRNFIASGYNPLA
ncbi:MAG: NUDIX domain-containing protein [Patescibacteria group bacterium]|nr:NUDIX domain-containing protein [Patescibacteria group bacterium]